METSEKLLNSFFTPSETMEQTISYIRNFSKKGVAVMPIPIDRVGEYMPPVRPGQVCGILAQTSHYKSSLLRGILRDTAFALQEAKSPRVLVHVSTEEDTEEQGIIELAVQSPNDTVETLSRGTVSDWGRLTADAIKLSRLPIFRISTGLQREGDTTDLHLSNVIKLLGYAVEDMKLLLAGVSIDYLQALPFDPDITKQKMDEQRRLQVRTDVYRLRSLSKQFSVPVLMAYQAKQKLEGAPSRDWQIPGQYDGHESADIAHRLDRILSIWLPKQTWPVGKSISLGNISRKVTETMIMLRPVKQRGGLPSGKIFIGDVNYYTNSIKLEDDDYGFEED